ncbi:MAG: DUF6600 domain-containing protein [Opitutaceae bacterium]
MKSPLVRTLAVLLVAACCGATGRAQSDPGAGAPVPADFPPGVQDVLRMARAGVGEPVILAQIQASGQTYRLTADQIITLTEDGVSQSVIRALIRTGSPSAPGESAPEPSSSAIFTSSPPAPPPTAPDASSGSGSTPPAVAPPGEAVAAANFSTFWTQLYPYGDWVRIPRYGWCWHPAVEDSDPVWRPYVDAGRWVYTNDGWFWQSDYPWGSSVFHYGRWMTYPGYGWVWFPGYVWAPAWVCWRQDVTDDVCGWAPLPPGVGFYPGIGLLWQGGVCWDSDFGLGFGAFVFAPYDRLFEPDCRAHLVPRARAVTFYSRSVVRSGYRLAGRGLAVDGLGAARTGALAHRTLSPVPANEAWRRERTADAAAGAAFIRASPYANIKYASPAGMRPYAPAYGARAAGSTGPAPAYRPTYAMRAPAPARLSPATRSARSARDSAEGGRREP